ncbi:DUF4405 domain-containing protein [Desulfopila sp. IMCC35008]|uniref:DUF4405 domain-containing protein n=1 Tax=Desulfopila sp. IMCC35008 TaxID=2653858 RepID=UPI0013D5F383|nr:DUF4405 domain-containing protein [Desulfopila sp. IMCC35008]
MNMRKITSMTLLLSLVVLVINSVVLYVVPEGRVAYWADWTFMGLSKTDWGEQHTTVGFLFAFAGILHIYYNWNPIVAYMKNKAREVKVFTGAFNVALALTVIFVVGTYMHIPPMSTILNISDGFKLDASKKYGEPPYGHAETSSLKMFTKKEGLDLKKSMELLKAANMSFTDEKQTIKEIAKQNNKSPQQVYLVIKPASQQPELEGATEGATAFLNAPKSGWGKRKVGDICTEYDLNLEQILHGLAQMEVQAEPDQTLKQVAEANGASPLEVYEMMVEIVSGAKK